MARHVIQARALKAFPVGSWYARKSRAVDPRSGCVSLFTTGDVNAVFTGAAAFSQSNWRTIIGASSDPTVAGIPNVPIDAKNADTGTCTGVAPRTALLRDSRAAGTFEITTRPILPEDRQRGRGPARWWPGSPSELVRVPL